MKTAAAVLSDNEFTLAEACQQKSLNEIMWDTAASYSVYVSAGCSTMYPCQTAVAFLVRKCR